MKVSFMVINMIGVKNHDDFLKKYAQAKFIQDEGDSIEEVFKKYRQIYPEGKYDFDDVQWSE